MDPAVQDPPSSHPWQGEATAVFQAPPSAVPHPYFSQTNAWKDGDMFKSCSETLFLIAVRAPTT